MKNITYDDLNEIQKKLVDSSFNAMENSYNPYSNFFVGAALLTKDDEIYQGANFENAAYGPTICAERSAILHANANGRREFKSVAVIAKGNNFDTENPTAPCGTCRQVLYEISQISGNDIEIILSNTKKDKLIITSINELLPLAFGPKDVGVDVEKYRK